MAAAAGTPLLRSVATKMRGMIAAPRDAHNVLLGGRRSAPIGSRCHASSRPSAADNKGPSQNKNVPGQLNSAKSAPMPTATKFLCLSVLGTSAFYYCWMIPRLEALRDAMVALRRERSILIKAVEECQRTHIKVQDGSFNPCQAQITQALGQGKESGGRAY